MVAAAGLSRNQEGKEGGSSLFILREGRGNKVWGGGGDAQRGLGRGGA
jgi:hypothetical protein